MILLHFARTRCLICQMSMASPGRVAAPGYSLTAAGWHMDCDLHRAATFVLAKLCSVVNKVRREDKRAVSTLHSYMLFPRSYPVTS